MSNSNHGTLPVVAFDTETEQSGFFNALVDLGYTPCLEMGEKWASRSTPTADPTILMLTPAVYDLQSLLHRMTAQPDLPVLGVVSTSDLNAEACLIDRCHDLVFWPCSATELATRLSRLRARRTLPRPPDAKPSVASSVMMVGESPVFRDAVAVLHRVSGCDAPVLITGETGTGKEMAARAIHYLGARGNSPFIPVNCGAIPDELIENELFGHERGAFTDARQAQAGLVAQADGGTLFLDEIGTLTYKGQCALLRFLQTQEYKPLGSQRVRTANVRVIAATNAGLEGMVQRGVFREDLLYRINVLPVSLPALRERTGDALLLANQFLDSLASQHQQRPKRLSAASAAWIQSYDWPGNIRELENLMRREFHMTEGPTIELAGARRLSEVSEAEEPSSEQAFRSEKARVVGTFERRYLERLLKRTGGNVSEAARVSGKDRRALGRLLKKHRIDRDRFRP